MPRACSGRGGWGEAGLRIIPRGPRVRGVRLDIVCAVLCLPDVQAVYKFPGQVWHLEALALRRALYVLCARTGIYCLSLDQASK